MSVCLSLCSSSQFAGVGALLREGEEAKLLLPGGQATSSLLSLATGTQATILSRGRDQTVRSVQFSSVTQLCPTLWDPRDCSQPGLPVRHQLPELTQTPLHRVSDAIQPSHSVVPFSSRLQTFPASGAFQMSQLFESGSQSIGVSASTLWPPDVKN